MYIKFSSITVMQVPLTIFFSENKQRRFFLSFSKCIKRQNLDRVLLKQKIYKESRQEDKYGKRTTEIVSDDKRSRGSQTKNKEFHSNLFFYFFPNVHRYKHIYYLFFLTSFLNSLFFQYIHKATYFAAGGFTSLTKSIPRAHSCKFSTVVSAILAKASCVKNAICGVIST